MTPRYDLLRIAVWSVILAVCLAIAYALVALALELAAIIGPLVVGFVRTYSDVLMIGCILAMLGIVAWGVMEA